MSIVSSFSWDLNENKNNAYAKFGGQKRVLWYFPKWPTMHIFTLFSLRTLHGGVTAIVIPGKARD